MPSQRERELDQRRREEEKDLATERDHGPRPLERLSSSPTTWRPDTDESQAEAVHGEDEKRARELSERQIPRKK